LLLTISVLLLLFLGYCGYKSTARSHFKELITSPIPGSVSELLIKETGLGQDYSCSFYFQASPSDIDIIKSVWFSTSGTLDLMNEDIYRKNWSQIFTELSKPLPNRGQDVSFYSATTDHGWRAMLVDRRTGKVFMTHWEGY
jgi:hypothetical protein